MEKGKTREGQYGCCLDYRDRYGLQSLGLMSSHTWITDPKRLLFVLARYKFVAKMLTGKANVLEVGCADGFATRIVAQSVGKVTAVDFDPVFIDDAKKRIIEPFKFEAAVHDIVKEPMDKVFDAAYSMDVIEHIAAEDEDRFITNIVKSLSKDGVLIIGTPSVYSQQYASQASQDGHVNCKDADQLKELLSDHFGNVFVFSMNDEIVHTGFYPMANYLIAVGTDLCRC